MPDQHKVRMHDYRAALSPAIPVGVCISLTLSISFVLCVILGVFK